MKCPYCSRDEDRVVDSRIAEEGAAIRRRRECSQCGQRFTTYERIEEVAPIVVKRSGDREIFNREKILRGLLSATKNRPVERLELDALVVNVEEWVRGLGREVSSEEVGMAVLERVRAIDDVAYVRFASVYKGFEGTDDFAREIGMLVKTTAPKSRS